MSFSGRSQESIKPSTNCSRCFDFDEIPEKYLMTSRELASRVIFKALQRQQNNLHSSALVRQLYYPASCTVFLQKRFIHLQSLRRNFSNSLATKGNAEN